MGLEAYYTRRGPTIDVVTQTSAGEPHSAAHGQERREVTHWETEVFTWKTAPVAPLPSTLVVHHT